MSGGSYNYFYFKVDEFADELRNTHINPRRAVLKELLSLISKAVHDIEWVDSGDYGEGRENEALDKVFSFLKEDSQKIQKAHAYDNLMMLIESHKLEG